jgi:hypothetical protein
MPKYEIQYGGKRFEVEAPSQQEAISAIGSMQKTSPLQKRENEVERLISERGQLTKNIGESFSSEGTIPKVVGSMQALGAPFQAYESALANPMLEIQAGRPQNVPSAFMQGVTGKRLGEFGDVGRVAGYPEPVNVAMGTLLGVITPFNLVSKSLKNITKISKFTDQGIMKAGRQIVSGSDEAVSLLSKDLDGIYNSIGKTKISNPVAVAEAIESLPRAVKNNLMKELRIEDVGDLTIDKVRSLKQLLGKSKPGAFKDSASGIDVEKVNNAYGVFKKSIQESLSAQGKEYTKIGKELLEADEAVTEAINASKFLKNMVTESTLKKPTTAGKAASGLKIGGDVSTREALNTVRNAGGAAKSSIDKAVSNLNAYNRIASAVGLAGAGLKTALFAGIVGSIGAKTARRVLG